MTDRGGATPAAPDGQPARHPGPGTVAGRHHLTGAQAEDIDEVMSVTLGENRGGDVTDVDHGRRRTQIGGRSSRPTAHGQLRAERSFENSPSAWGTEPSSSPRASASMTSSSFCRSSRAVGVSTSTWT